MRRLRRGDYGFSKLRPVFLPKPNSDKERIICVPIVADRLVQRTMLEYFTARRVFPIYNSSSYGFIRGRGPREAIEAAITLRGQHEWCLKTDIEAFFDRVPREYIKQQVSKYLKAHSLTPLIHNVIDNEVNETPQNRNRLARQGLKRGRGIRQGMPLSPLLANLVLADFDREIQKREIKMIRYADDLIAFFDTKEAALAGKSVIAELLHRIQLTIPEIADGTKTVIVPRSQPLLFLGREIVHLGALDRFVARVSSKQITKITDRLFDEFSVAKRMEIGDNFQATIVSLSKSLSAYLGIYQDVYNFTDFQNQLRGCSRSIIRKMFNDLFGEASLRNISEQARKFLGIEVLDDVAPNPELDV